MKELIKDEKQCLDEARREAAVGMIGWLSNELLETRICVVDGIFYDPENLERIPHSQLYSLYLKSINKQP